MTDIERRELILQQLRLNYSVKVTELSKLLYIGEATIRRDLGKLEKGGYCKRVYGGAVRIDAIDRELPADVRQKMEQLAEGMKMPELAERNGGAAHE